MVNICHKGNNSEHLSQGQQWWTYRYLIRIKNHFCTGSYEVKIIDKTMSSYNIFDCASSKTWPPPSSSSWSCGRVWLSAATSHQPPSGPSHHSFNWQCQSPLLGSSGNGNWHRISYRMLLWLIWWSNINLFLYFDLALGIWAEASRFIILILLRIRINPKVNNSILP